MRRARLPRARGQRSWPLPPKGGSINYPVAFWGRGHRKNMKYIMDIIGEDNRGNDLVPLFSSLFSRILVKRGCRNIMKGVVENIIHIRGRYSG